MSESFGTRLRRQRERSDVSLASIVATTKISRALLEGLERDDVSRWPSGIFRRAFVRMYAEAIGLDPELVLREFAQRFPDPASPSPPGLPVHDAADEAGLRLTLDEGWSPFLGGRILRRGGQRSKAVAFDAGIVLAATLVAYVLLERFWMPLGLCALGYYLGGILVAGNTPGVWLFAPQPVPRWRAPALRLVRWRGPRVSAPIEPLLPHRARRWDAAAPGLKSPTSP
jgi:hypothetical protein